MKKYLPTIAVAVMVAVIAAFTAPVFAADAQDMELLKKLLVENRRELGIASEQDMELFKNLLIELIDELEALGMKVEELDVKVTLIEERIALVEKYKSIAVYGGACAVLALLVLAFKMTRRKKV